MMMLLILPFKYRYTEFNFREFRANFEPKIIESIFQVGKELEVTHALPAPYELIDFNEEITLPIAWPTVVKYVCYIFLNQTESTNNKTSFAFTKKTSRTWEVQQCKVWFCHKINV